VIGESKLNSIIQRKNKVIAKEINIEHRFRCLEIKNDFDKNLVAHLIIKVVLLLSKSCKKLLEDTKWKF